MPPGYYRHDQFLVEHLDLRRPLGPGIWTIEISAFDLILEPNITKQEEIFIRYEFVVLPISEIKNLMEDPRINQEEKIEIFTNILNKLNFYKYWSAESVCFKNNMAKKSCQNSFWSTFYPDPKSDLFSI